MVSTWKVIGMCGLKVVSTEVKAHDEQTAKRFAKNWLGMWCVLRTIAM